MNNIPKYLSAFFLFFYVGVNAQEVGKKSTIPSKTTSKGRKELREDKRIKANESHLEKANERKLEEKSDKSFHKKGNHKVVKKQKNVEIRKKG
jgi:hypothetical protein